MKKIIISIISIIILILLILGTSYYMIKKPLIDTGKKNALSYIKDKYGFTPKIIDIRLEYEKIKKKNENPTYTNKKTGFVKIDMKHNNKVFRVYIDGEHETTIGYDDYQYNQIKNDLIKSIRDEVGIATYRDEIHYSDFDTDDLYKDALINTYYDGTNLKDVTNNLKLLLEYTSDVNFIGINIDSFINKDVKALLIEYDNIDTYESVKDEKITYSIYTDTIEDGITYYSDYANKILAIENNESTLVEINIREYEDIYFKAHDDEGYVSKSSEKIDPFSKWNGTVIQNGIVISDDYEIITKNNEIYIYIPDEIIKKSKKYNDYYLAIQYDNKNEERHYDGIRLKKYSNYYVAKILINNVLNIKFNIVGI